MSGIFVSHSSSDNVIAYDLADRLRVHGFEPFVDFEGIAGGAQWERAIYDAMQRSVALVLCATPEAMRSPWVFAEVILARFAGLAVIPLVLRECELPSLLADTQYINVARDPAAGYHKLIESLNCLGPSPAKSTWPADTSPYPGLAAFDEDRASLFFGREQDIERSLQHLRSLGRRKNVLVIAGPSGSGKSSLLRAGVLPRLKRGALEESAAWHFTPPFVPGETPFRNLALGLRIMGGARSRVEEIEANLRATDGVLRECLNLIEKPNARVVLPIDQLEEIQRRTPSGEAADFLQRLRSAVDAPDSPVVVLATLRSDFLSACLAMPDLGQILSHNVTLLGPLDRPFMRMAIEEPARRAAFTFEPGVVDSLLQDASDADSLPLLAFHVAKLWHDMRGRNQKIITFSALERIGSMVDTVRRAADAVLEQLPAASRDTVLDQLTRLADVDERGEFTRRRERLAAFSDDVRAFLQLFSDARLLSTSAGGSEISVVHEAVLRAWPPLRSRLEAKADSLRLRRDLERDTAEWERLRRSPALLWRRERLAAGFALLDYDSVPADDTRRLFLEISRREEHSIRERESALLARRALRDLAGDPERAILLAIASIEEYAWTTEAERALREAIDRCLCRGLFPGEDELTAVQFAPDESMVLTAGVDGIARLWDVATRSVRQRLSGHEAPLRSAAFNALGSLIVTAGDDETARIWDAATGSGRHVLRGHDGAVRSAMFNVDGTLVVTAGADGTARLWETSTGRECRSFPGQHGALAHAAVSRDGKTVVTLSASLPALWDVSTGRERCVLLGHEEAVRALVFSPDETTLLTASDDGTARIWNASNGLRLHVLRGHEGAVTAASFSPDGATIATASADRSARLWDTAAGEQKQVLRGHDAPLTSAEFSADGQTVFTASVDGTAAAWSAASGRLKYVYRGHVGPIRAVDLSRDGATACTAGADGAVRLWPLTTGAERFVLRGHTAPVLLAVFSPDGASLMTASHDGTARIWDVATGRERSTLKHDDWVTGAVFSADGASVITASHDGTARLWDAITGRQRHLLLGYTDSVTAAAFNADGSTVVTASDDGLALFWDATTGELRQVLEGQEAITRVLFSGDESTLATVGNDGAVRLWDLPTGKQRHLLEHGGSVTGAVVSPDGMALITSSEDGTARVWDLATARVRQVLRGHKAAVSSVACDPGGTAIVTASRDFTARIWEPATGRERHVLRGHDDSVWSAAFSPDGLAVVTTSADRTVRIWDAATARERHILRGHENSVTAAAFSPDGMSVVSASTDGTARLWDWRERDQLLELARARVFRVLTDREREDCGLPVTRVGGLQLL